MRVVTRLWFGISLLWQPMTLPAQPPPPVPVILDTDMCGDCDDAGALAMLHHLADRGEANILACVIDGRDADRASGAVVRAINTYCHRPEIPLGAYHGDHTPRLQSAYTARIRDEFAPTGPPDDQLPSATAVYRRTLAAAGDGSVTIVSIGFLTNLHELLLSPPDADSPLDGPSLVRRKVQRLVVMGGTFPQSEPGHPEFNVANAAHDGQDARYVAEHWPGPILFSGFEIGVAIHTGPALAATPRDNPVRRVFELYPADGGGTALAKGRPSWDETAVLAAVRGPGPWRVEGNGRCAFADDGSNRWEPGPEGMHAYLVEKTPPVEMARLINTLIAGSPMP